MKPDPCPDSSPAPDPKSRLAEPNHPAWMMVGCFPPTELGAQAWAAFERDLPRLLEKAPSQWVAYRGGRQLGIAPLPTALYDECLRQGFAAEEIVIAKAEPLGDTEAIGMGLDNLEEAPQ
jgi:hypothetical protein